MKNFKYKSDEVFLDTHPVFLLTVKSGNSKDMKKYAGVEFNQNKRDTEESGLSDGDESYFKNGFINE